MFLNTLNVVPKSEDFNLFAAGVTEYADGMRNVRYASHVPLKRKLERVNCTLTKTLQSSRRVLKSGNMVTLDLSGATPFVAGRQLTFRLQRWEERGPLYSKTTFTNISRFDGAVGALSGAAVGVPASWEPFYCVLQQDRRTLTAYTSEELAQSTNNNGEYSTRSLPRVRIDAGSNAGTAGVRLRCWAAPPSITEEEVEDEIEEDAVSLRAVPVQGVHESNSDMISIKPFVDNHDAVTRGITVLNNV
ncbi:putative Ras GTPase-activating protein [Papilio xuthus]|uniref:Putative Ras GTPase-activating protein n=1 Tax=Papilio xuthus TaxID=66420 RepID=A0A194PRB4_PAPXU|nr:putative Ras GTPase-activating protein [Papilio xuthus]